MSRFQWDFFNTKITFLSRTWKQSESRYYAQTDDAWAVRESFLLISQTLSDCMITRIASPTPFIFCCRGQLENWDSRERKRRRVLDIASRLGFWERKIPLSWKAILTKRFQAQEFCSHIQIVLSRETGDPTQNIILGTTLPVTVSIYLSFFFSSLTIIKQFFIISLHKW